MRLRDSIHSVFEENDGVFSGTVGSDLQYLVYIEQGTGIYNSEGRKDPWIYKADDGNYYFTRGIKANPFLTTAFLSNKSFIDKCIRSYIDKAIGGL